MDDRCTENSSDSNDTIILSSDEPPNNIDTLLKKYSGDFSKSEVSNNSSQKKFYDLSDLSDEDGLEKGPVMKRLKSEENSAKSDEIYMISDTEDNINLDSVLSKLNQKYLPTAQTKYTALPVVTKSFSTSPALELDGSEGKNVPSHSLADRNGKTGAFWECDSDSDELESFEMMNGKKDDQLNKKCVSGIGKLSKQAELEKKREMKKLDKEKKALEKQKRLEIVQKEKEMKQAVRTAQKSIKPDECIKHIIVKIDNNILMQPYGDILKAKLKSSEISLKCTAQVVPNLITWIRNVQTVENMFVKKTENDENFCLLIMESKEFSKHIKDKDLATYIQNVCKISKKGQVTLAILGMDRFKTEHQMGLIELELFTKCYVRPVKTNDNLATLIIELTKAVAQVPYKLQKAEKFKLQSEYFNDSNKDCVRVDKDGNGLGRLWQQMLTMFPLARLETAEAIVNVYPTPSSLFKAYENCPTEKEGLLQDLPIRRAQGPFTQSRKIGPELSRKCSNFFCANENIFL